ncbi:FkbM family methyltransferase [Gloeothece verrucosa]|uniref:Methyltransferase FkbM family n=1 Tax=Gloeothece verrucosa (strain PCC 7822) TaxID=497965 RepID=E0UEB6_GLOV7|nr:FkbM family methyltransferase [Gloeothece verrucosa]ADN14241.1 methyltransferase FkbM family [Gloeothece verrucosa PCC 7822]
MSELSKFIKNLVRQNYQSKIVQIGKEIAEDFLSGYWNEAYYNMPDNGEFYLIESAQKYFGSKNIIAFDVGANHGEWTRFLKNKFPNSSIYCFEILPETFSILEKNLGQEAGVTLINIGLSDRDREIEVTSYLYGDTCNSIQPLPRDWESTTVICSVKSGNQYCQENQINQIDFLKIDTEGHELSVLKGFNELLQAGKITLIQFEYGLTYIPPRITLGDVYHLLAPYGYSIGRLYPTGVKFKPYNLFEDENFRMGNYVAIHQSADRLLDQIKL